MDGMELHISICFLETSVRTLASSLTEYFGAPVQLD